jgi:chorismate-pyruvate lyase
MLKRSVAIWVFSGLWSVCAAGASAPPAWVDTPLARLEALALLATLNSEILSSRSATLTLEQWCREHALAEPAVILAHRTDTVNQAPSATTRTDLKVSAQEELHYRRVELKCGERVLSVAENWYVPGRLTAKMNRQLETTQTPFGKVVQPLEPHRETIAVRMLWQPLAEGWERDPATVAPAPGSSEAPGKPLDLPSELFEHRAILYSARGEPIAEVDEVYQRDLLAFPQPQLAR